MFSLSRKPKSHELDDVIEGLVATLRGLDEDTEQYDQSVKQLKTLMELRSADRRDRKPMETGQLVAVAANVLGILAILGFEKTNVITTKALGFVPKIDTSR